MAYLNRTWRKLLQYKWWSLGGLLVLVLVARAAFFGGGGTRLQLADVLRKDITQTVSETGSVKPAQSVELAFQVGGRIASVSADVGARVFAGQMLVSLDTAELRANLAKAQANLAAQVAKLAQDQISLNNSYASVGATLNSGYTNASDAVRIKVDPLFLNAETNYPQLVFNSGNSQSQIDAQSQRIAMTAILTTWLGQINGLSAGTTSSTLEQYLASATVSLNSIENFLNTLNNTLLNAATLSASTISTYKGYISSARTEIDSSLANANTLLQAIGNEKAALASDAATQKGYAADIDSITAQLSQTTIFSPLSGVVTKQDAKVGEIAAPNAVLTSVISDSQFEIDTNVPEVDIAKIAIGDHAQVTLDAYGNDAVFDAVVTSIDPAETVIEGVATYLTKLQFSKPDSRIKPGMTANIDILSATHTNVLAVPQRAVRKVQDKEIVSRYLGASAATSTVDVEVKTGLRGSDGYVEILSGLNEHDQVVIPHSSQ